MPTNSEEAEYLSFEIKGFKMTLSIYKNFNTNRQTLEDITYKHANYLNAAIQKYLAAKNPNPTSFNVTNIDWKDYDGTKNSGDWRGGRIS